MDRLVYTAMSGANASAQRQATIANNLANASTHGFRAELTSFRAVPIRGEGATTRVLAAETTPGYSDRSGPLVRTDRNLDAAAQGNAWFAVQGLDGTEAYTRSGQFQVTSTGALVHANGLPALGDGGPIQVPEGADVTIGVDGTLTAKSDGQPPTTIGRLKLITAKTDDPLRRSEDGLFRATSGNPLPADPNARVQNGALEGSNVNPIEAMVAMIAVARQFEAQIKLMQSTETNDRQAAQLLGMQN